MIFDFKNPDYPAVMALRAQRLAQLRKDKGLLRDVRLYYREAPWDFINDWGMTHDPRLLERGLPAVVPFILFPRQIECLQWVFSCWKDRENGVVTKSRDMGCSWMFMGLAATMCLFYDDMVIGMGSRKEEYVDLKGSTKSLFHRGRLFINHLPVEFKGAWDEKIHSPSMRIMLPTTRSLISGEVGDSIGRGDRSALYFVDEAEFLEHPELTEAALSQTTNCRIDLSSVSGSSNPIARKVMEGRVRHFIFHWRDDPRKNGGVVNNLGETWYEEQQRKLDPVVLAQEVDMDRSASLEGIIIPSAWAQAAIDAHLRFPALLEGGKQGAMDVADEGRDKNAFGVTQGAVLTDIEAWSGKGSDIQASTEKAFRIAERHGLQEFLYDADGLGCNVKGDARIIQERRQAQKQKYIGVRAFRGSGEILEPRREYVKGRKNKDMFQNFKAQAWWWVRMRFEHTWLAINGRPHEPSMLLSISSKVTDINRLMAELSQPTMGWSGTGKMVVDKTPDGALSPNMADTAMMLFAPKKFRMQINQSVVQRLVGRRYGT